MALCLQIIWCRPRQPASMLSSWTLPPLPQGGVHVSLCLGLSLTEAVDVWPPPSHCGQIFHAASQHPSAQGQVDLPGAVVEGLCGHCGSCKDVRHFFQCCPCAADLWDSFYVKMVAVVPGSPSDLDLRMLAFNVYQYGVPLRTLYSTVGPH